MSMFIIQIVLVGIGIVVMGHALYSIGRLRAMIDVLNKAIGPAIKEVGDFIQSSEQKVDRIEVWRGFEAVVDRIYEIDGSGLKFERRVSRRTAERGD